MTKDATVINQYCTSLLNQTNDVNRNDQFSGFLDRVHGELIKDASLVANRAVMIQIVDTLITCNKEPLYQQPELFQHSLLIILRNRFTELLLEKESVELVTKLSIFFHSLCFDRSISDPFVKLILYLPIVDGICRFLTTIEHYVHEIQQIEVINRLLKIFQRIQMVRSDLQEDSSLEQLFLGISQCFSSQFMLKQMSNVPENISAFDPIQTLLFDTCIELLYWQPYEDNPVRRQNLSQLCDTLLQTTVNELSNRPHSEPILRFASLLSVNLMMDDDKIIHQDYFELVRHCISALNCDDTTSLSRTLLECLCHFTYCIDLLLYMKNDPHLKPLLLKLSEDENFEIAFNAYRILALLMSEDDIKTLQNANKIVGIFYLYFISMVDDPIQKTAFQSLLHSLKSLAQHEQVKNEIIQQEMLPLLIQCVLERQSFHSIKIQQYALEILLTLSFKETVATLLKQNNDLMQQLRLLDKSEEEHIQRAANHLIWQLEHSNHLRHPMISDISSKLKYDIMISYSHSDRNVCFQLCDHLIKDGFRIWLDRDEMHGDVMSAMAHAIENSEFVIICMSEAYKQSPYCQAEAQYAFQRRCKLVPLLVKEKYKPDSWLGIIASGKLYVDFSKHEFNIAYSMLKNEIARKRNNAPHVESVTNPVPEANPVVTQHELPIMDLPHCVDSWSEEHVRYFLTINNFTVLLPVFPDFNGQLLHQAYSMCEKSRESMFQSMRQEVGTTENAQLLTLGTYLRFLEAMKKYIPLSRNDSSQAPVSALCNIM